MVPLKLIATTLLMVLCGMAHGQTFRLIAHNAADSVVLRWAPVTAENWRLINQRGYLVERIRIGHNGPSGSVERLTVDTVRPMDLETMKRRFPADHPTAPIAAQALHGASFAPAPTGASASSIIDGANELALRYAMAMMIADTDAPVASALGLRFSDRTVENQGHYLYRVIAFLPDRSDTAVIGIDRGQALYKVPTGPDAHALEMEGRIELNWPRVPYMETFTAFVVERARMNGPWERLNQRPFLPTAPGGVEQDELIRFTDSTITNYAPYRYRVRGITPFGETSEAGAELNAMGRDRTPPPPPIMQQVKEEAGRLVVHWEQAPAADLAGFRVEKAIAAKGAFSPLHTELLPAGSRSYADTSSFLIGENHYRVLALDTAGNASVSLTGYGALADSVPPSPPTGLRGRIDSSGVVTVEWTPGREKDLLGFRVFFANSADHEFNNLTPEPLPEARFRDTIPLRTLTKRIYYNVVAVDRNFNHSAPSAMLMLEKPDVVAPVMPVIEDYQVSDSLVRIRFVASTSDDVARHRLYRRVGDDGTWELRAELTGLKERTEWSDRDVRGPQFLAYAVQAVDSAGNASERTPPLIVRVAAPKRKQAVADVSAVLLDDGFVNVRWSATPDGVSHFVIYSTSNGGPTQAVGHVPADQHQFTDTRSHGKGSRTYLVKAVFADGSATVPVPTRLPLEVR